ncbi:MAG: hypothetical protein PHO56_04685 [Patescibacteria group bacterium]|nr:hypothetical protein [Patescibacteria group bacterium]
MTLKNYLILMIAMTLVCWGVFAGVVISINPNTTNWPGFAMFYASLFLSLLGTSTIIGFLFRFWLLKQQLAFRAVGEAFRQSFLFVILILAALFLLSHHLFTWLNIVFLIVGIALLELCLISYSRARILRGK